MLKKSEAIVAEREEEVHSKLKDIKQRLEFLVLCIAIGHFYLSFLQLFIRFIFVQLDSNNFGILPELLMEIVARLF